MNNLETKNDLHLHTIVSDGDMTPDDILTTAAQLGLDKISITDHDAVGAYTHFDLDIFGRAEDLGLLLIPGIELDSDYNDVEIHILGYGIDINNTTLLDYLKRTQAPRRQRIIEQIDKINRHYNDEIINTEDVCLHYRDTLMKPHLVRTLLAKNLFDNYRTAAKWMAQNIKVPTIVPKPHPGEMIELIKEAGGEAYLAHPGYYILEWKQDIDKLLKEFIPIGLEGIEADYRYYNTSPDFTQKETETEIINLLHQKARQYDLKTSRGSDAHDIETMKRFNS